MATFRSKYTNDEIESTLDRSREMSKTPFVMYYDSAEKLYRFFPDNEKKDAWVAARDAGEMTTEIKAYEFTLNFAAPAPYNVTITIDPETKYNIAYGSTGHTLDFTFATFKDGSSTPTQEDVDIYYTFKSGNTSTQFSKVYSYGTNVSMNIDEYLKLGTNSITILVSGRTTGATNTLVVVLNVIQLDISSTFDISKAQEAYETINVTYTVKGGRNKAVKIWLDGILKKTDTISDLQSEKTITDAIEGVEPGKHTLQIQAENDIQNFKSTLLYYEFVVTGEEQTVVLIENEFPSTQEHFEGRVPGLTGEQYVVTKMKWAYFSSNPMKSTATITWRLYTAGGTETTLATRKADILVAGTGIMPEPLSFIPTEYGDYNLQSLVEDPSGDVEMSGKKYTMLSNFTIHVVQNTSGVQENTSGMTMKLTGVGRSNDEPSDTRASWTSTYLNTTYSGTFYNQPWNSSSGWNEDALWLNNGATCVINNRPFSSDVRVTKGNGMVFEIDFETFNIDDDNAEVLRIGGDSEMHLVITSTKATLVSGLGYTLTMQFKSDERVKLAFIVYPESTGTYPQKMFIQCNGVLSQAVEYAKSDSFVTDDFIHLGNANSLAGIKVYFLRTYSIAYTMYDGLTNYIIDSGENISSLVAKNDIYTTGTHSINMDKLESTIATIKITADMQSLISTESKNTIFGPLEITIPNNPDLNFYCNNAQFSNAGQSTLGLPIPSMHVKLDKNGNQCYRTTDNQPLLKNRWAFRDGNAPEKKFRLQANYMDSSGCHNGAFFRLFNQVAPKVQVDGKFVLRTPAQRLALDRGDSGYAAQMKEKYGNDPSGNEWAFPYTLNMVPDSIPAIVIWRADNNDTYKFLGQYVIMEEKKSNFTGCQRSIYDTVDTEGYADPFKFKTSIEGSRLWDNTPCRQFELLQSGSDLVLFLDDNDWSESTREDSFELIYPDPDDLEAGELETVWQEFKKEFVHPVVACRTYGSTAEDHQNAFNALYTSGLFDRWQWAAYYCLMLRNCCVDSSVRNMEITTYETTPLTGIAATLTQASSAHVWLPKWWDNDMQCGLQQSGECNLYPRSDRSTLLEGSQNTFVFAGRFYNEQGEYKSSWLWDALEACPQFQSDVNKIDEQLYQNLWRYKNMTDIQDNEYVAAWSQSLFNETGTVKYINYNHLLNLQGDRTAHRHWFLRTNYNYFDAKHVCGEYKGLASHMRTMGTDNNRSMKFKAAATSYFGWGHTQTVIESGIEKSKGTSFTISTSGLGNQVLQYNDPIQLYSSSNYEEIDLSEIARFLYGDVNFHNTYDQVNGSKLKVLNIGIPWSEMHPTTGDLSSGVFNTYTGLARGIYLDGSETDSETQEVTYYKMNRLEELTIQGLHEVQALDISGLTSLKKYFAAGTNLTFFNPADGVSMTEVKLPSTILTLQANGCSFSNGSGNTVISWWKTKYKPVVDERDGSISQVPCNVEEITIPASILEIKFTAMGSDSGARQTFVDWIRAVYTYAEAQTDKMAEYNKRKFTLSDVNWTNFDVNDLLKMAKIPAGNRTITGYIKCNTELTSEQMNTLMAAFGENIFTVTNNFKVDCDSTKIIVSATGSETTVQNENLVIDGILQNVPVIHIKQGSTANFQSIGFPITNSGTTYTWGMYPDYRYSSNPSLGSDQVPKVYFGYSDGEHICNYIEYDTGKLVTEECQSNANLYYRVYVQGSNHSSGNAFINIEQRTYPLSSSIDISNSSTYSKPTKIENVYQVIEKGKTYFIDATHLPTNFTGHLSSTNGGTWSVSGFNSTYVSRLSPEVTDVLGEFERYRLYINDLPNEGEHNLVFNYTSHWKNGLSLTAEPIYIALVGNIENVLTYSGNSPFYMALQTFGVQHAVPNTYSSFELKQAFGDLHIAALLRQASIEPSTFKTTKCGNHNVLSYLKNVDNLDFSGCTTMYDDVDIGGMTNFSSLNLSGTSVSADIGLNTPLTKIIYGSPKNITIENPSNSLYSSNVLVESISNLGILKLSNFKDNDTFRIASEILSSGNYNNLSSICIEQTEHDTVRGLDIERFANLIRSRWASLSGQSSMVGTLVAPTMYEDSKNLLNSTFQSTLSVSLQGTSNKAYYVRWNDTTFLHILATHSTIGGKTGGDGTGITLDNAERLTSFGTLLQNQTGIRDLSDLWKCTSIVFADKSSGQSEFSGCTGITKLGIPYNATEIGTYTFENMSNLQEVSFANCSRLETIADNSFTGCTKSGININLTPCSNLRYANLLGFPNAGAIEIFADVLSQTLVI